MNLGFCVFLRSMWLCVCLGGPFFSVVCGCVMVWWLFSFVAVCAWFCCAAWFLSFLWCRFGWFGLGLASMVLGVWCLWLWL